MYLCAQILCALLVFISLWGLIPSDRWWIRAADFPRIQSIAIGGSAFAVLLWHYSQWGGWQYALAIGSLLALSYESAMVLPYTPLWKKQVRGAKEELPDARLSLLVSNVLTPNQNYQALLALIQAENPDIVLTLESDHVWQEHLDSLDADYPHSVKVPLDNLYGMHLYSKLPLIEPSVQYLVVEDIPSIRTRIRLRNGKIVWLYGLHPMPPSPTEADKSITRDAELLLVGKCIRERNEAAILFGDLNDVAWSRTTRAFRRISGLLDPRIGRYFVNTFHAKLPFLRWALDHIFHSPCFSLVKIRRLPKIGSDHFPVLTILQYEASDSSIRQEQSAEAPEPVQGDIQNLHETIQAGLIEGKKMAAG